MKKRVMEWNPDSKIFLENERVKLEPLSWDHLNDLLIIAHDHPDLLKFSPSKFGDKEALTTYFKNAITTIDRHPFAIFDKLSNSYAGSTSYLSISPQNLRIEIGATWIGKKFQRTGLNRNNKYLLLQYAFEELNYERVELKTDARNTQSRTAIMAIGAKYEGELRSHTVMTDGFRRNTVYYSILKNEWFNIKKTIFEDMD